MHSQKILNKTMANFEMRTINESAESNETDLSDVGLCSLNIHEHTYNLVLCLLKIGTQESLEEAYQKLTYLLETIPP